MTAVGLKGVIAAIVTPLNSCKEPDYVRLIAHAEKLFGEGCDGINLLGTTGEATSLTVAQRKGVMQAVATSGLPLDKFMVGTGTAALGDTVELTRTAAELGFAGALVLPSFYYKPVPEEGVVDCFAAIVKATQDSPIPLYLYNFPALSGTAYTVKLTTALLAAFGPRIAGLKDSSGDLDYSSSIAALSRSLAVFPSNEAVLLRARAGEFAGCISATANVNAAHCAAAFQHGDVRALERATMIRAAFDGIPLVPAVKAVVAQLRKDPAFTDVLPPLCLAAPDSVRSIMEKYTGADA